MSGKGPTVAQLKELLSAKGLSTTGTKAVLQARLNEAIANAEATAAAAAPAPTPEDDAPAQPPAMKSPAAPVQSPVRNSCTLCQNRRIVSGLAVSNLKVTDGESFLMQEMHFLR